MASAEGSGADSAATRRTAASRAASTIETAGEYLQQSFLGRIGKLIEPAVRPLGWDWRIGCAAIASFPAREVVVATLGVIYNLGRQDEVGCTRDPAQATLGRDRRPVFNVPVALSIMVFFALCAQCVSTLVVIRRETGSWRWPLFTFAYMTALAYVGALVTYQVGTLAGGVRAVHELARLSRVCPLCRGGCGRGLVLIVRFVAVRALPAAAAAELAAATRVSRSQPDCFPSGRGRSS